MKEKFIYFSLESSENKKVTEGWDGCVSKPDDEISGLSRSQKVGTKEHCVETEIDRLPGWGTLKIVFTAQVRFTPAEVVVAHEQDQHEYDQPAQPTQVSVHHVADFS